LNSNQATTNSVPFADLHLQYLGLKTEIDAAIAQTIASSAFIRGPQVEAFEAAFAQAIGTSHCVSAGNGTDTLYIAMRALKLQPGDQVIVPAMSWISTSETVTQAGGTVVFCDVDEHGLLDLTKVEEKITSKTVGIIPVHFYGQPVDMHVVMGLAAKHGLWVLEDCAQAHLATFDGQSVGTFGVAGSFSFYPGKNLGAMGDAGALVTNDAHLARQMGMFARHGGLVKGDHQIEGINSRLDGIQAAILNVKLPHLQAWTLRRRAIAAIYGELLEAGTLVKPVELPNRTHVYHVYVIRTPRRTQLIEHLKRKDIQTAINYKCALPFLPCYASLGAKPADFPGAFALQNEGLCLPMFSEMTDAQVATVAQAVNDFGDE
jgi:dTDP-4-amino-4,6-dideoxygalactose transaminase